MQTLFSQYHSNDNQSHVLLKVVALNRLYSTNIFAVHDMARHIHKLAQEVDAALRTGAPEIVGKIATVIISATGKTRRSYSFASKFCSWHNRDSYPIWDSHVDAYLCSLRRTEFSKHMRVRGYLWNYYPEFVELMTKFKEFYGLGSFSFKDIDKFLYAHGGTPPTVATNQV